MINPIYFYDFELNMLNDIELTESNIWKTYTFNGRPIPRVSEIIEMTTDSSHLIGWAAAMGANYKSIKDTALTIGTAVHEKIENFLLYGKGIRFSDEYQDSYKIARKIENSFSGFMNWYNCMREKNINLHIYAIEKEITCPWFGGTADCIIGLEQNGVETVYVLDFKTSKVISANYYLQTYAYYWGLMYNKYCMGDNSIPDINGLAILRVDKDVKGKFDFKTVEFNNPQCRNDTENLHHTFKAMIDWFYSYKRIM